MIDIESTRNFIVTHARACYPNECCGLIIAKGNKQEAICGRNISDAPRHHFMLHPHDYASAEDAGEILAIYHSHCGQSPEPTKGDKTTAEKNDLPLITVGLTRKPDGDWEPEQWTTYKPCGWKHPLIGRPFVYGVLDCFTLLQDYYKEQLGIELPDLVYGGHWWNHTNLFEEHLEEFGFMPVKRPQEHDIIVMRLDGKYPNHVSIYIGDGMMLHHGPGHLSGYHPYNSEQGYYARSTTGFYRHRDTGNLISKSR
jgi:proteasome lid subunit RPN8/RPN11